jgi:deoxyribodipyrimidine photolyase
MSSSVALWWIRRDLRLTDNQAFASALASVDQVVPVFTVDPKVWNARRATKREAFLLAGSRRRNTSQRFIHHRSARRVMA